MGSTLGPVFLGILCIVIGIFNARGNISTLHSYHRKWVSEENRIPFGKKVGLGMLIIGVSLIIFGGFTFLANTLTNNIFIIIGSVILIIGLIVGLCLSFYAMIKYNKGIF